MFRQHSDGEHPEPELLERFMLSRVDPEERRYIVRHLIHGCPCCLEVTRQLWALGEEPEDGSLEEIAGPRRLALEPASSLPAPAPAALVELIFAQEDTTEMTEMTEEMTARLYCELEATPLAKRLVLVRSEERFRTPGFCDRLTEESRKAVRLSPPLGVRLGELATTVAEQLDSQSHGTPAVHAARIRAWAWYGDARRRAGDRDGAASALAMADHLVEQGLDNLREGADVMRLQAALQAELGQPQEAERLLDQALGVYASLRDCPRQGQALIQKAGLARDAGQVGPAIGLLIEGADLLDRAEDREEQVKAVEDLISLLLEAERGEEALATASRLRSLLTEPGDRAALARLRRKEGKAALLADRIDEAEAAFREADHACLAEGLGIEAALALIDRGLLYLHRKQHGELRALASEVEPHLLAKGMGPGERSALVVFQQHCDATVPRPALFTQLQKYIESALRPRPAARISAAKPGKEPGLPGDRAAAG
jgi:tetratricopeptide (TPR) repeat protein